MKILAALVGYEHTFTSWVAKEFTKARNEEPTLQALADRVFPYAKSAIEIGLTLESPAIAAAAAPVLDKIKAGMDVAGGLLYDFGAQPTVASTIATVEGDIGSLETVAGIKNQGTIDAIAKGLSSVNALAAAVTQGIAAAAPAAA